MPFANVMRAFLSPQAEGDRRDTGDGHAPCWGNPALV